jgi:hypothetical protein
MDALMDDLEGTVHGAKRFRDLRCPIVPQKVFPLSPGCSRDVLEKSSQWRYP